MTQTTFAPSKGKQVVGRDRIVQAASLLFAQRGFHGVSISEVAKNAGVVKSAIYHHFDGKDKLYIAVLIETAKQCREQLEAGAHGRTWQARLRGATRVLGQLIAPRSHVLSLIIGGIAQIPAGADEKIVATVTDFRRAFVGVFVREIENGIAAGDLRRLNPWLSGACLIGVIAASLQANVDSSEEERVDFALAIFLHGLERRKK